MDPRLIELYVQRGRLRERIGSQRSQVARDLAPLGRALAGVDRARARWHQAVRWGYVSWRQWARVRQWLSDGIKTL